MYVVKMIIIWHWNYFSRNIIRAFGENQLQYTLDVWMHAHFSGQTIAVIKWMKLDFKLKVILREPHHSTNKLNIEHDFIIKHRWTLMTYLVQAYIILMNSVRIMWQYENTETSSIYLIFQIFCVPNIVCYYSHKFSNHKFSK